jgi:hypothetical protein
MNQQPVRLWTNAGTSRDHTGELSLGALDWTAALREVVYEDDFAHQFRYFGFSNHLSCFSAKSVCQSSRVKP